MAFRNQHLLPKWYIKKLLVPGLFYYGYKYDCITKSFKEYANKQGINPANRLFTFNDIYGKLENPVLSKIDEEFKSRYDKLFNNLNNLKHMADRSELFKFIHDFTYHYISRSPVSMERHKGKDDFKKLLLGTKTYTNFTEYVDINDGTYPGMGKNIFEIITINPKRFGFSDTPVCEILLQNCFPKKIKHNCLLTLFRIDASNIILVFSCPNLSLSDEIFNYYWKWILDSQLSNVLFAYGEHIILQSNGFIVWPNELPKHILKK